MNTRPGFYVEGRHFSLNHRFQACARADWLAREWGRQVSAIRLDYGNVSTIAYTANPGEVVSSGHLVVC